MKKGPRRLLKEEDIDLIKDELNEKDTNYVENYVNLLSGREGQHVMSDIEISTLIDEVNKTSLLELLRNEKGSTAEIMIETVSLETPHEIMYKEEDVRELLKDLETDYYDRFDF